LSNRRPPRRDQPVDPVPEDRLPPHSPHAERGVLGCLLIDGATAVDRPGKGEALEECLRRKIEPGHFYDLRHQRIFTAVRCLAEENKPADLIVLSQHLRNSGELEAVGGLTYLNQLETEVPSASNVGFYLGILAEKFVLRQVLQLCVSTSASVFSHDGDVAEFVGRFETSALALSESHVPTEYVPIPTCVPAYIDAIEARFRGKQEITGLPTPFWYLNNITCGLQPREFIVIGARPSCGKTAFALDLMRHASHTGTGVLFFSIEMAKQEIMGRVIAAEARVDGIKLRNGFWKENKSDDITKATGRVGTWSKFLIDDRSYVTGQDVFIAARRAKRQFGIGLVVVDYLQLMQAVRQYPTRLEAVAECSAWLKRTAKELDLPVVACAQLSRDSEKERAGRAPLMSDLRECGNIEQDADVIALLYEPKLCEDEYDDVKWMEHHVPDDPKEDSEWMAGVCDTVAGKMGKSVQVNRGWAEEFRRINLVVAKNRNGQTGPCELVYQRRSTRFVDAHSPKRVKEEKGQLI